LISNNNLIKNIAIVWENQEIGGVNSYLYFILSNNNFSSFNISIYTNKNNKASVILEEKLKKFNNIKFFYYNSFLIFKFNFFILKFFYYLLRPIFFFITYLKFKIIFFNKKFELIIAVCGGYGSFRSEPAALLSYNKKKCLKTLIVCHDTQGYPFFQNFILKYIDRVISKNISSIISISKATRDSLRQKTDLFSINKNLHDPVIYIGVPKVNINKVHLSLFSKKENNIYNLGIVSRIEPYKGHEDLCVAFSELPNLIKDKINIFFIGPYDDEYKNKISNLISILNIQKYITFTGYVHESSQEIISNLDLLLSLTRNFEGFGISLAEAMSVKTPILATKVGAITEFLNEKNAYLIEPSSPSQITEAIINFINNNNLWKIRADIAYNNFFTIYNSDRMCEELLIHFKNRYNLL
jgi:glycosyltransferase involved in cell wall biosynthesis